MHFFSLFLTFKKRSLKKFLSLVFEPKISKIFAFNERHKFKRKIGDIDVVAGFVSADRPLFYFILFYFLYEKNKPIKLY